MAIVLGLMGLVALGAFGFLFHVTLHPPRKRPSFTGIENVEHPRDTDWPYEELSLEGYDEVTLRGWFIPAPTPPRACVILLHGHSRDKRQMLGHAKFLREDGYDTFLMDLRHHGESDDAPFGLGYFARRDLAQAVAFLKTRSRTSSARFAALGLSLGGTTSLVAAADGVELDAVIADSASVDQAQTLADYARILYGAPAFVTRLGLYVAQWYLSMDFSEMILRERLVGTDFPALFLHGRVDPRVPLHHAESLCAIPSKGARELVIFDKARHIEGHKLEPQRYANAVLQFLAEIFPPVSP